MGDEYSIKSKCVIWGPPRSRHRHGMGHTRDLGEELCGKEKEGGGRQGEPSYRRTPGTRRTSGKGGWQGRTEEGELQYGCENISPGLMGYP